MKKLLLTKLCMGGVILLSLSMCLTSCEGTLDDIFGEWSKPTGGSVTPSGDTPTVDDVIKYGFKVTDLAGVDRTEAVTSLKMSTDDGPIATAEVSGGKITIKAEDLSGITTAIDFWFEAEIGGKNYVAKVNIDPTTLSPETDKTLSMATMGDVILADGTFAVSTTTGTKVAMITYVGSETGEATNGYKHGLALAMKNASVPKETWCSQETEICLGSQYDTAAGAKGDMSGIANTDALCSHATHTHDAATKAKNFMYDDGVAAGAHPDVTSKWFLPSVGQWQKMIEAYGFSNLNTVLGNDFYWSSTEYGVGHAWIFNYANANWAPTSHICKKNYEPSYVRACLAF